MTSIDDEWMQFLNKELVEPLAKMSLAKATPSKEIMTKATPSKEIMTKATPSKEIMTKATPSKEIMTNATPSKAIHENTDKEIPTNTIGQDICKEILHEDIIIESLYDKVEGIIPGSSHIEIPPVSGDELYISTKTKVLFLNKPIDIHRIFWHIPVIEYGEPRDGVVKKQMKIVSKTREEYEEYRKHLEGVDYYTENVIKQIDNPQARRIKFKDERKITIGISKKDIMNCRGKVKNAFYNCFAMIFRFMFRGEFKEIHVKIFNTGKLEIPGILNMDLLDIVKRMILEILVPNMADGVEFVETDMEHNVLINSNFNCGFYINRNKLNVIMRDYKIETSYDPCSYPGIKCKFYFNHEIGFDIEHQNGQIMEEDRSMKLSQLNKMEKYTEISFMIFRTGSCLIVGNCSERILVFVYDFIRRLLLAEYQEIHVKNENSTIKAKKTKLRKRQFMVTPEYYMEITQTRNKKSHIENI